MPSNDLQRLQTSVELVLTHARKLGASQAEAGAGKASGLSVTARMRDVETLEYHRDQSLGVTVYFGYRKGSASTSDMSDGAIEETVSKACSLAQFAAEDPYSGLVDPEFLAADIPDLSLCHPWELEAPGAIELALACEAAALNQDKRLSNSEGATVGTQTGAHFYGNSHGFMAGYLDSEHSISCAVLAIDGSGMQRDFEYTVARDPGELASAESVGKEAGRRALQRLGSVKLDTCSTPVIFPARLARGLLGTLIAAIKGSSLYRRATFLLDALDKEVFASHVIIEELPHIPKGLASAPFDDEGVATRNRVLVENGVLRGYVLASYYARKLAMVTTGNAGGIHNLQVSNTGESFADLLKAMDRGFVVSEMMGQGINIVTGDYSRGAAGFWVENGEVQYPVHEITIAGNLRDMYRGIVAIGIDTDYRGGIRTGSILIDKMTIAGN
jgi:PmbA protein